MADAKLPKAVRLKLDFLWRAALDAAEAEPPQPLVAQKLVASLRRAAADHDVDVPGDVLRAVCPACSAPCIAGITCVTRTRTRTRRSPDAMRWAGRQPLKTQLVTTCKLCGDVRRAPAARRVPAPNKKAPPPVSGDFVLMAPAAPPPQPPPRPPPAPVPRLLLDSKPRKRKKGAGGNDGARP